MKPNISNKDRIILLSILEAIEKIERYTEPFPNADEFFEQTINFDAAMMNFIVIGEMVTKLSDEIKEAYDQIDWFKIKGFRNIIAHDYFGIDAEEVWQIISTHLTRFKDELNQILRSI